MVGGGGGGAVNIHEVCGLYYGVLIAFAASCHPGSVRIIVGESDEEFYTMSNEIGSDYDSGFSVIDDMLSRGRIEVCNGTVYEAVCADGWNYADAAVVCRELGFSPYGTCLSYLSSSYMYIPLCMNIAGAIPLGNDIFRGQQRDRLPVITNITCTGSELRLSDCAYEQQTGDCETAAIICQSGLAILM